MSTSLAKSFATLLLLSAVLPGAVRAEEPVAAEPAAEAPEAGKEPAPAAPPASPPTPEDASADLNANYEWPAGTIQEQLDGDATAVPFGKGAIFVPAMTNPLDEPPISVWQGENKVAEGTTGRRVIVPPGEYSVEIGTGAVEQRFRVDTEVRELMVSVVPVTWAGLAVHVVDDRFNSVRGSYEIIHVETREYVDIGFGADEQAGEPVTTWILEPGLYKIVRVGETYRARSSFATLWLQPGKLTDFLLVIDETGDFKGAGEVPRDELFLAGKDALAATFVLGGTVSVTSRQNSLTRTNGESFSFRAFLDTKLSALIFESPLLLRLQVEEGGQVAGDLFGQADARVIPWLKTFDRADLDGLYVYRVFPWLGPYARFNIETNLFEELVPSLTEEKVRADILDAGGTYVRSRKPRDTVRTLPSVGLTSIKEGIGINVRVFKALFGETQLRAGLGALHLITRQLIGRLGDCANPVPGSSLETLCRQAPPCPGGTVCELYQRVPTTNTIGVEATVVGRLSITRWVTINVEADTLIPFDDIKNIILDIESTLALKLTSFVSFNYVFRYLRNPALSVQSEDPNRFEHDLLVRFSIELP